MKLDVFKKRINQQEPSDADKSTGPVIPDGLLKKCNFCKWILTCKIKNIRYVNIFTFKKMKYIISHVKIPAFCSLIIF